VKGCGWRTLTLPVDACNFYGKLSVYDDHGGIALAQEEGEQIAKALGEKNIACILQNHGYGNLLVAHRACARADHLLVY
jgi:hypothetical protein